MLSPSLLSVVRCACPDLRLDQPPLGPQCLMISDDTDTLACFWLHMRSSPSMPKREADHRHDVQVRPRTDRPLQGASSNPSQEEMVVSPPRLCPSALLPKSTGPSMLYRKGGWPRFAQPRPAAPLSPPVAWHPSPPDQSSQDSITFGGLEGQTSEEVSGRTIRDKRGASSFCDGPPTARSPRNAKIIPVLCQDARRAPEQLIGRPLTGLRLAWLARPSAKDYLDRNGSWRPWASTPRVLARSRDRALLTEYVSTCLMQ